MKTPSPTFSRCAAFVALMACTLFALPATADTSNGTSAVLLNSLARFMGQAQFDANLMQQIDAVLDEHNLATFTDRFWQGFLDFSKGPGWGKANGTGWIEYDPKQMDIGVRTIAAKSSMISDGTFRHSRHNPTRPLQTTAGRVRTVQYCFQPCLLSHNA